MPVCWTLRQNLDQRETQTLELSLKRFFYGFFGLNHVLWATHADPRYVDGAFTCGKHLAYANRITSCFCYSAHRRRGTLLPTQCCGSHLASTHSIDRIINEYRGDFFSSGCSVNNFCLTNSSQIAVSLICENHSFWMNSPAACRNSWCTTMSRFIRI